MPKRPWLSQLDFLVSDVLADNRVVLHELQFFRLRVSNAGLRIIDKNGIDTVLVDLRARGEV